MVSRISLPSNCPHGVVMIVAFSLCSRISATQVASFSSEILSVLLKIMVPACSIWLTKNSPKFLIYIFAFVASTTATALFNCTVWSSMASCTAFMTSDNLPTPEGSIRMRSGVYWLSTSFREAPKSPTREQQIQPEFISLIWIPASCRKPPSIPISPNSFSISTVCVPFSASFNSFWIRVVLPAPKKPETMSIFVISICLLSFLHIKISPVSRGDYFHQGYYLSHRILPLTEVGVFYGWDKN